MWRARRPASLAFRAVVALDGHFGGELKLLEWTDGEREELRGWIALHKQVRPLFHGGALFRYPAVNGRHVHGAVDESFAIIVMAQSAQMMRQGPDHVRVPRITAGPLARRHGASGRAGPKALDAEARRRAA